MRGRNAVLLLIGFGAGAVTAGSLAFVLLSSGPPRPPRPPSDAPLASPEDVARADELAREVEGLHQRLAERGERVRRSATPEDGALATPKSVDGPRGPLETVPIPYFNRDLLRRGEVLSTDAVRGLVLACLDVSAEDAARFAAAAQLLDGSPRDLAALADRLLVGEAAPATIRPLVLAAVARSVGPDVAVPSTVRAIAYDPLAIPAEWRLAAQALVLASPAEGRAVIESRLASTDVAQRTLAISALAASRAKETLPLLVETVMREDLREHVDPLIDAIALTKDRKWSAVQMTGPPDTPREGDLGTAWASKAQQMGEVWVELAFKQAVVPSEVRIRETLAPGAVVRIEGAGAANDWITLWQGEATSGNRAPRWFAPGLRSTDSAVRRIRLVLDTDAVPGWSEIDAVELVGAGGQRQWAASATASTSYAD